MDMIESYLKTKIDFIDNLNIDVEINFKEKDYETSFSVFTDRDLGDYLSEIKELITLSCIIKENNISETIDFTCRLSIQLNMYKDVEKIEVILPKNIIEKLNEKRLPFYTFGLIKQELKRFIVTFSEKQYTDKIKIQPFTKITFNI
ncbi:MAG: hypothetical protein LRY71_11190 [Bacillaceae bacterium]|nr:hypothetical protein [Bacillaceae bacterium]